MAEIYLITGGSRSGKSAFAQQLAEQHAGPRLFLATSPVTDSEMAERIRRHVGDRRHRGWDTVEEQVGISGRLHEASGYTVILVDCLTLWVNNLMYEAEQGGRDISEDIIVSEAGKVMAAALAHQGKVIFVTNEVGSGIVPGNKAARQYRDLVGRCNQQVASGAERVYLVSCGIPIQIKGTGNAL